MLKLDSPSPVSSCSDLARARVQLGRFTQKKGDVGLNIELKEAGIDPRLKPLPPAARPYPVLRIVTAIDLKSGCGLDESLPFLKALSEKGSEWQWYIFGEPLDEVYFQKFTGKLDSLGFEDNVTFLGEYTLEAFLHLAVNMDFGFYPDSKEPFGICALEAQQLGLPMLTEETMKDEKVLQEVIQSRETLRVSRDFSKFKSWRDIALSAGILSD